MHDSILPCKAKSKRRRFDWERNDFLIQEVKKKSGSKYFPIPMEGSD